MPRIVLPPSGGIKSNSSPQEPPVPYFDLSHMSGYPRYCALRLSLPLAPATRWRLHGQGSAHCSLHVVLIEKMLEQPGMLGLPRGGAHPSLQSAPACDHLNRGSERIVTAVQMQENISWYIYLLLSPPSSCGTFFNHACRRTEGHVDLRVIRQHRQGVTVLLPTANLGAIAQAARSRRKRQALRHQLSRPSAADLQCDGRWHKMDVRESL